MRDYARTTLMPRHRPVVRALAEALFKPAAAGNEADPSSQASSSQVSEARLDAFPDEVDRFISPASKTLRFGLVMMLDLIRWAPLFVVGKPSFFENLPYETRVVMLDRMERSKIASLTLMLVAYKTLMTVLFFEEPSELAATGYTSERVRWKRVLPRTPEAPQAPRAAE